MASTAIQHKSGRGIPFGAKHHHADTSSDHRATGTPQSSDPPEHGPRIPDRLTHTHTRVIFFPCQPVPPPAHQGPVTPHNRHATNATTDLTMSDPPQPPERAVQVTATTSPCDAPSLTQGNAGPAVGRCRHGCRHRARGRRWAACPACARRCPPRCSRRRPASADRRGRPPSTGRPTRARPVRGLPVRSLGVSASVLPKIWISGSPSDSGSSVCRWHQLKKSRRLPR